MNAIALAAAAALVWGSADYCGGRATRHARALAVTVVSQAYALPLLTACVLVLPGVATAADLAWGAGAGILGLLGLVALYQSLSTGAMSVAAPTAAVTGAVVPLAFGLLAGERPGAAALWGAVCAVLAIGLVSLGPRQGRATTQAVGLALTAGLLFGVFFILLDRTDPASGMWPLVGARVASVALGLLLALRLRTSLRLTGATAWWTLAAGIGDISANAFFLLATREGLLSVVAPIAALYPVSTVLWALTIDREKVRPVQVAGLGLAATALVLTAV